MYSKAEVARLRQAFWTALGQYMAPVPSAEGETTNWINYKTGVKHVYFRMQADKRQASIGIELTHPDAGIRELFWEQFLELRTLLHETLGEDWTWEAEHGCQGPAAEPDLYRAAPGEHVQPRRLAGADFVFQAPAGGAGCLLDGCAVVV